MFHFHYTEKKNLVIAIRPTKIVDLTNKQNSRISKQNSKIVNKCGKYYSNIKKLPHAMYRGA